MTFRKRITWMVISILLLSIILTGTISAAIINNYFQDYLSDTYEESIEIIMEEALDLLSDETSDYQFHQYLNDPIVSISIISSDGVMVFSEENTNEEFRRIARSRKTDEEFDEFVIEEDGENIGILRVERSGNIQDSETVFLFNMALFRAVGIAAIVALLLSFLLSRKLSKGITRDLKNTAKYANAIESSEEMSPNPSKIIEIKFIQDRLEKLSSKLKVKDQIRKEKLDQIAHETRTPITVLKSQMEGALDGVLMMDDYRLSTCLEATSKLQNLTQKITSVLEVDQDEITIEMEKVDVMEEIRLIQTGLALQYKEKGLSLEVSGPDNLEVESDRNLLSVSLYNLLINSLKFTKSGGVQIHVSVNPRSISIKDTGIGIAGDKIEKIFDPYYRAVTKEEYPGDGLGLHITKKNIEAIGGTISVESKANQGTQFIITL